MKSLIFLVLYTVGVAYATYRTCAYIDKIRHISPSSVLQEEYARHK